MSKTKAKAKATILIPTYNHGKTLEYSIQSALNQTIKEIEIFVIGDGISEEGRVVVKKFLKKDKRVTFFDFQKGPRHGEIYRHIVLKEAKGEIVCYLSDDDLFLPSHVALQYELLQNADFSHSLPVSINSSGEIAANHVNLAIKEYIQLFLKGGNCIPLSCFAHRLDYYKTLPFGWRTTPESIPTDLYMYQQFFKQKDCRLISGHRATVLNFPSPQREKWTKQKRLKELHIWFIKTQDKKFAEKFQCACEIALSKRVFGLESEITNLTRQTSIEQNKNIRLEAKLKAQEKTATWQLRKRLKSNKFLDGGWEIVKKLK